jgi:hypothetical protein
LGFVSSHGGKPHLMGFFSLKLWKVFMIYITSPLYVSRGKASDRCGVRTILPPTG